MRQFYPPKHQARRGFTLVELLVVIAIIGALVALLIPAVGAARARMRTATCLNNMREIGTGIISYESSKQRYPGYIEPVKVVGRESGTPDYVKWIAGTADTEYVNSGFAATENNNQANARAESRIAWSAHILPQMDRQDIWDIIQGAEPANHSLANQQVVQPIGIYICPDDTDVTSAEGAAGLSYVVNTGGWDWDNSGNYLQPSSANGDVKENGLFHNLLAGNTKSRMSAIRDGAATTLMLSENMHKNAQYSWLGVTEDQLGEQHFGMVWVADPNPQANCNDAKGQYRFTSDGGTVDWPEDRPCFARPASNHPGGNFNVIFADHHGDSISPDIEYIVYQQLLTSHGAKSVDPAADPSAAISEEMRTFRTAAPLSEADFD